MANPHDLDLPIAHRRTPRRRTSTAALAPQSQIAAAPVSALLKTPSKPRCKKRVRFSDPEPDLFSHDASSSTGLTPMIKRSSLGSLGEPSPKRLRGSAEGRSRPMSLEDVRDRQPSTRKERDAKTRKRNHNSAKKAKAEAEIQCLRVELANRDAEIVRLQNETLVHDTERILELEQQIERLRTELAQQQLPRISIEAEDEGGYDSDDDDDENRDELPSRSFYDWTLAPREPFSESYLDEDDGDRDVTMMDIACSTPSRRPSKYAGAATINSASASFPTPPCTSPPVPDTPCSMRKATSPLVLNFHTGVQASLPDPEKEALEAELTSLRRELGKLTATLESHAALQTRLSEKLSGATSPALDDGEGDNEVPSEIEEHLNLVLQKLSEHTATLSNINTSLRSLGFPGANAGEIIGEITSGFRAARLELEYLTPGEITLPLSSHCAEVLDLILVRLRQLGRKASEDDETIDEYHALELSLRQQLSKSVDAMDVMRAEREAGAATLRERDGRIAELEVGLDRLKGAAEGYRRDIAELETLVERLEDGGKTKEATLRGELAGAQDKLTEQATAVADLEARLAETLKQAETLETQLREMQIRREAETRVRNKSYGAALALRDARVFELRREIYGINDTLRAAHDTIMRLRIENSRLERRVEEAEERSRLARETVDTIKVELEKVTTAAGTKTPAPLTRRRTRSSLALEAAEPLQPGSFLSGGLARSGSKKGAKKRRCDSGVGMLDDDDI